MKHNTDRKKKPRKTSNHTLKLSLQVCLLSLMSLVIVLAFFIVAFTFNQRHQAKLRTIVYQQTILATYLNKGMVEKKYQTIDRYHLTYDLDDSGVKSDNSADAHPSDTLDLNLKLADGATKNYHLTTPINNVYLLDNGQQSVKVVFKTALGKHDQTKVTYYTYGINQKLYRKYVKEVGKKNAQSEKQLLADRLADRNLYQDNITITQYNKGTKN